MAGKIKFNVLSPDGFTITMNDQYDTEKEAEQARDHWCKRFEGQGYYSMSDRTRLTLEELPNHCQIIPQDPYEEDEDE